MKTMRCPFCHRKLFEGQNEKFENLCDHVSNPNMSDYPERKTYRCSCDLAKDGFWDDHGDFYTKEYKSEYFNVDTNAINSFSRRCDKTLEIEKKYAKKWWFKYIENLLYSWEFGESIKKVIGE